MIVTTAGHVDHGKTTLVRTLTGVDTDRLPEEKARGITIDLGYAYMPAPGGASIGFVDVPGHERLVHTMLAGAAGVDFALLMVAADDGPMPQTLEHLAILDLLGVRAGLVALTKVDRVDAGRLARVTCQVRAMLQGLALADAPIVPCSAVTGDGIADLRARLDTAAAGMPARATAGGFRLAVDRAFTLPGIGLVATGAAHSGAVQVGQRLVLSPAGLDVRVRGLHSQNRASDHGQAGQRIALNITGPRLERDAVARGMWLVDPALHVLTSRLEARLRLLPGEARALRHWTPVHVHIGAADIPGRIGLMDDRALEPGGSAWVQLTLETPTVAAYGDRFVIRDQSARRSLGGRHIVNPYPPRRGARKPEHRKTLQALDQPNAASALGGLLDLAETGLDLDWFRLTRNMTEAEMLALPNAVLRTGSLGFSLAHHAGLRASLLAAAADHVAAQPDSAGGTLEELLLRLPPALRPAGRAVLRDLVTEGALHRFGPLLHLPGHAVALTLSEENLWASIQKALLDAGMDQPRAALLAERIQVPVDELLPLLCKLGRLGRLCRVSPTYFMLPEALSRLAQAAASVADGLPGGILTVGRFREATGIGRNATMPVLEFFDKVGFTTRRSDGRRVRLDRMFLFDPASAL